MRPLPALILLMLAGCAVAPAPVPVPPVPAVSLDGRPSPQQAVANFLVVVRRVEPVAEQTCRAANPALNCDYQIVVDDDLRQPLNAFQTVGRLGRPIIVLTTGLIAEARNQDELAFILGHEAAHHVAGHLARQRASAARGAELLGSRIAERGGNAAAIRIAQRAGAELGALVFSKDFELEADRIGTVIAMRSGFDPVRGAAYFTLIEDPGNVFLGTHPPNAARIETVRRTVAELR